MLLTRAAQIASIVFHIISRLGYIMRLYRDNGKEHGSYYTTTAYILELYKDDLVCVSMLSAFQKEQRPRKVTVLIEKGFLPKH